MRWTGGALVGWAVLRAEVLPRWTGAALILAMALRIAPMALGLPEDTQMPGAFVQSLACLRMGVAVLRGHPAEARSARG